MSGLAVLTSRGVHAPDPAGALLMIAAGASWGVYSIRGRAASEPFATTTDNFIRTVPLAAVIALAFSSSLRATWEGLGLAVASGALASAGGYVLWYAVLPVLGATRAGTVQLASPALAAAGAVALLGETMTARIVVAALAILSGIALTVVSGPTAARSPARGGSE